MAKNGISIRFKEFTLIIDDIDVWDEEEELSKIQTDTVVVYPELGEMLSGNSMSIIGCNYNTIAVYQRFENSITIMNEGPHCDMLNWKHYTSDWEQIAHYNGLNYTANSISEEQMDKFIHVDIDEFKNAVMNHCGEKWAELVKNVSSVKEYPCGIGTITSKIELRIRLSNLGTSKYTEKIIKFEIAMGC